MREVSIKFSQILSEYIAKYPIYKEVGFTFGEIKGKRGIIMRKITIFFPIILMSMRTLSKNMER